MHYTYLEVCILPGYKNGDYRHNLLLVLRHIDPNDSDSADNWKIFDVDCQLSNKGKCVCSHCITYEFTAKHIITEDTIIVGSDCVNYFNQSYKKITSNAIRQIKNPNLKICPGCDTKVRDSVVAQKNTICPANNVYCVKCFKDMPFDCHICDEKPINREKLNHMKQHAKTAKLANSYTMKWGKHKGLNLLQIKHFDKGYLKWLSEKSFNEKVKLYASELFSI